MDSAAGAPLEEIRSQAQKEVETNYLIMTLKQCKISKRDVFKINRNLKQKWGPIFRYSPYKSINAFTRCQKFSL